MKLLLSLICVVFLFGLFSCDQCGDGGDFYTNNTLTFNILDKTTKKNLLVIGETPGYGDAKVINTDGSVPKRMEVRNDGRVLFNYVISADQQKPNQLISRQFFMYFDENDNDTIDISFNTYYNKCNTQLLKYMKVSYNDSVYYEGKGNSGLPPSINFLK